jgi:hypothetical protein
MAHPDRTEHVGAMIDTLNNDEVRVYWDPAGPPSGDANRVWAVAREAWQMHDPAATWHVLLQDDAQPCTDLLEGLSYALEHVPADAVVSPYLGAGRNVPDRWYRMAAEADRRGASWIRSDRVMWGVCLVLPVARIAEMIEWADRKRGMPDDMRVAAWAQRHKVEAWYPWPSLVDHLPVPSLTKHRALERVAQRWHTGSALEPSWSGPVVTDPMMTLRSGPRSGPRRRL